MAYYVICGQIGKEKKLLFGGVTESKSKADARCDWCSKHTPNLGVDIWKVYQLAAKPIDGPFLTGEYKKYVTPTNNTIENHEKWWLK